jgi:hypothetical protein
MATTRSAARRQASSTTAVLGQDSSNVVSSNQGDGITVHDLTSGEEVLTYQKSFSRKQENKTVIGNLTGCAYSGPREERRVVRNKRKKGDGQCLGNGVVKRRKQEIEPWRMYSDEHIIIDHNTIITRHYVRPYNKKTVN